MTEKEMIEETAKDIVRMAGLGVFEKAEYLIKLGYRKIPEGSVVMSKEELENMVNMANVQIKCITDIAINARKETAKEIAKTIKSVIWEEFENETIRIKDLHGVIDDIVSSKFGVEVEE